MSACTTAREAIQSEIRFLVAARTQLSGILDQLGESPDVAPAKKRGRKSAAEKAAAGEADLAEAVGLIKTAGKVAKADLMASGKVKMISKGRDRLTSTRDRR